MTLAWADDSFSLERVMQIERPRLVRLCARISGNAQAADDLAQIPIPDVAIITKSDIFDRSLVVVNRLKQAGFQQATNFPSFEVFGRPR